MASTTTLKVNGKEYAVQFNNNNQVSGVVKDGIMVDASQDPLVKILQGMARYDDGQKYSKPQPKVKIGDQVIKLGNRYMTPAERESVKSYTKEHLTGEGRSSGSSKGHDKETFDKLTALIQKYENGKTLTKTQQEELFKELKEMRKFYMGCLSKDDLLAMILG